MNTIKTTPKDFFIHLGATIALYIGAVSIINLAFSIINYFSPDALASYFYSGSIAWPISMLVVLIPILYVLEMLIGKDIKKIPEKNEIWINKWRVFLTLFLTGALIAGDIITLINTYLNGEISSRFIYKFLAILVISAVIFSYYILEKTHKAINLKRIISYIGLILVVLAIVLGFIVVGTPQKQRDIRFDDQRVGDLQNLQWQVVNNWQQKGKLPSTLKELNDPLYGSMVPTDPETKTQYEYIVKDKLSFELCATFSEKTQDNKGRGNYAFSRYPYDSYLSPVDENYWNHEKGHACFKRTIDPDKYPKANPMPIERI